MKRAKYIFEVNPDGFIRLRRLKVVRKPKPAWVKRLWSEKRDFYIPERI
jgi:hypothetical protein